MPNEIVRQLKQIPLFSELEQDDLRAIAELVQRAEYPAGTEVCRQGQLGQAGYYVESGELLARHIDPDGIEHVVARLGPGKYFGETSLLLGEPRDATVEVIQDATLLYLNKQDFDQLLEERAGMLDALQMRSDVEEKRLAKRFSWQDPEEVVIVSLHKHPAVLIGTLFLPTLLLALVWVLFGYLYLRSPASTLERTLILIIGAVFSLPPIGLIVYHTIDSQNDDYVVTNKRVVHEERIPLVRQTRAEAPLQRIQNVHETRQGLLPQLYNFGDLFIETAGERGNVVFRQISNPPQVRDAIFEQMRRVQAGARAEQRAVIRDELEHRFGVPSSTEAAPSPTPVKPVSIRPAPLQKLGLAVERVIRFFIPPARDERGNTVTWRKHWIRLVAPIFIPTLLITLATAAAIFLLIHGGLASPSTVLFPYGFVMIILLPWWFWVFEDWQNDLYQVTDTRMIDIERRPLFLREERREASLGVIQNVTLEIPGVLGNLLNYGSVTIETAGAGAFTFDYVEDPRGVQAEIFQRLEAFRTRQRQAEADRRQTELLDWISVYDRIRTSNESASPTPSSYQQEA